MPPFGRAPLAWLDAALPLYDTGAFDVLFPTQEQVAVLAAARNAGDYAGSGEETAPWRGDRRAAVPLVLAALSTLVRPAAHRWFVSGSVSAYALTPDG